MRVPVEWLHQYVRPELSTAQLAERLAMTGTEGERIEHPDADRLSLCKVDIGADADAQIVCGAPNVRAGQSVAVARPGAVMPDGTRLGQAKLRGVLSEGMIPAASELD